MLHFLINQYLTKDLIYEKGFVFNVNSICLLCEDEIIQNIT